MALLADITQNFKHNFPFLFLFYCQMKLLKIKTHVNQVFFAF